MNPGLNENESELSVLVLAVSFEVLSDGDGLLDQHVQVLWDIRGETAGLQDSEDFVSGNNFDLCDTMAVSQDDTNL